MIRAKFQVSSVKHFASFPGAQISLQPVHSNDSTENKSFWEATPQGAIELTITNPDTASKLELGKYYYVDFSEAKPESAQSTPI